MKRSDLEQYLGKVVTITLFDNDVITGELHKTEKKWYFLINPQSCFFRCTYVKKLKER